MYEGGAGRRLPHHCWKASEPCIEVNNIEDDKSASMIPEERMERVMQRMEETNEVGKLPSERHVHNGTDDGIGEFPDNRHGINNEQVRLHVRKDVGSIRTDEYGESSSRPKVCRSIFADECRKSSSRSKK